MPCRVGIATNPEARRLYWQNQTTGFANWEILEMFRSKTAAREYETAYALRHKCTATLGDSDVPITAKEAATEHDWWYVYHFDYTAEKT